MSKDKIAVKQAKSIDSIKLTIEERELLGICGLESAEASELAKVKGSKLKRNMELIVVRKLLEVDLVELDEENLPKEGNEPMSENLFIPEEIVIGTSVFKVLRSMIVSPAALFGKDDKDLTRPERSTLEACKRAFDGLLLVEPDDGHISGLWTVPDPYTVEEKASVSTKHSGMFRINKDGKQVPITIKELIIIAVSESATKTLDDSKRKKILADLFAETLKA